MKFSEKGKQFITVPKYENCFIYFLLNKGEVVYVGQTEHGLRRPLSHTDKEFDEIKILYCNANELDLLEDVYIQKYAPIYNKQSNKAMRWGLLRVRDCIRKQLGMTDFSVPKLKHILKQLKIETTLDYFTGKPSISLNEYKIVMDYLKGCQK